jgi:glycosyltransferase involved in cell wall biosynthesis
MRIAQVVPRGAQPGSGVFTVAVHLSAALAERGHDVEVWPLRPWSGPRYAEDRLVLEAAGVPLVTLPSTPSLRQLGQTAAALAEVREIDVVHLHGAFNIDNAVLSRVLRTPYVFSPHSGYDEVSLRRSRGRKLVYGILFERAMLRRAALVAALTEVELNQLRAYGAKGPFAVIPNGVRSFDEDVDGDAFRKLLGIPRAAPLAVFVGRLDIYRKGLDILVEGIAGAPEWHLALAGPRFRDAGKLDSMIAGLGVADRVHLIGERHGRELWETVKGADLFTLLSRWEGLPMALLDALALGTPAVVSPAVERLVGVEAAGAGWVAGTDTLSDLLNELPARRGEELAKRRQAARTLASRYDWAAVAQQYGVAYERARLGAKPVRK